MGRLFSKALTKQQRAIFAKWERRFLRAACLCTITKCGQCAFRYSKCKRHRQLAAARESEYLARLKTRKPPD